MSLFGLKEKKEIERLRATLSPEQVELADLQGALEEARKALAAVTAQRELEAKKLDSLRAQLVETDEAVALQSFGVYKPRYDLMRADEYRARLLEIRAQQKEMIKNKTAVTGSTNWTVNNSVSQGRKMVSDMKKLLLRAFNAECDDVVEHVRYSNLEASEKRITSSQEAISKLGRMMGITITPAYYRLKIEELYLAFEYQQKKQQEKEEQKDARARLREEAKLAKEIEEERKKLEKEQRHYQNALHKIEAQLAGTSDIDRADIEQKRDELVQQLQKIDQAFKDVDYREANQRAGYVYIISNVGAFGENVYKIGMTRRLEPMERIDELSSASVPFKFDVHALIFSDDAPALEAILHQTFRSNQGNKVNPRKEFYRVDLEVIKKVVKENHNATVQFIDIPDAEEYRETLRIERQDKAEEEK